MSRKKLCRLLGYVMMIDRKAGCVAVLCQSLNRYGTQRFRDKCDSNMNSVLSLVSYQYETWSLLKALR